MLHLMAAALLVCACVTIGLRRASRDGRLDPLHPLLFPTIYVAVATLAPTAYLYGGPGDLGLFSTRGLPSSTPTLMALAVVGFTLGAAIPFKRRITAGPPRDWHTLTQAGRVVLVLIATQAAYGVLSDAVLTRGLGQDTRDLTDIIGTAGVIAAPLGVALIAAGRSHLDHAFTRSDLLLMLATVALTGLNGNRGTPIAVVLMAAFAYASRPSSRSRIKPMLFGTIGLGVFAYAVVDYRTRLAGETSTLNPLEVLLRDLASVPFTTGYTARAVENTHELGGSSLWAALVRQVPGPIADPLLGPPHGTGALVFRQIYPVGDAMGYGYSIPAEGVLNFGTLGALVLPFALGAFLAWLYARADFSATRAIHLAYYVAAATLPFAWRSDVLAATKGILYPLVATWLVLVYARTVRRHLAVTNSRTREPASV